MKEIFVSYQNSIKRLGEILLDEKTVKTQDSAIKRFEFTTELAWKCLQKFLRNQEIICRSPKECLKEGFKFDLVDDDEKWLMIFEDRNSTVHTYDERTAEKIYERLNGYLEVFKMLENAISKQLNKK